MKMPPLRHCLLALIASTSIAAESDADPAPVAVGEDVVILTNRHRINGYLLEETPRDVTIRTVSGRLTIPRHLVARTEAGFQRRFEALDPDDYQGHLDLARWALARNKRAEALQVLRRVADHDAIDLEGLRLLARLSDEIEGPEAALPIYRRYRDAGGRHAETLRRLEQLEAIDAENQAALEAYQQELAGRVILEGMEATKRWTAEDPRWSNRIRTRRVEAPGSGGDQVLRLSFSGDSEDRHKKAAVRWRENLDVRASNVLYIEASNPGKAPLGISVAVKSGDGWEYFESRPVDVPADQQWHPLKFDLTAKGFKCAKDGWASHGHRVDDVDDIREIQIQVHNGTRNGNLFINNVGFLSGEE